MISCGCFVDIGRLRWCPIWAKLGWWEKENWRVRLKSCKVFLFLFFWNFFKKMFGNDGKKHTCFTYMVMNPMEKTHPRNKSESYNWVVFQPQHQQKNNVLLIQRIRQRRDISNCVSFRTSNFRIPALWIMCFLAMMLEQKAWQNHVTHRTGVVIILPTQIQCTVLGEVHKRYHTFALKWVRFSDPWIIPNKHTYLDVPLEVLVIG